MRVDHKGLMAFYAFQHVNQVSIYKYVYFSLINFINKAYELTLSVWADFYILSAYDYLLLETKGTA